MTNDNDSSFFSSTHDALDYLRIVCDNLKSPCAIGWGSDQDEDSGKRIKAAEIIDESIHCLCNELEKVKSEIERVKGLTTQALGNETDIVAEMITNNAEYFENSFLGIENSLEYLGFIRDSLKYRGSAGWSNGSNGVTGKRKKAAAIIDESICCLRDEFEMVNSLLDEIREAVINSTCNKIESLTMIKGNKTAVPANRSSPCLIRAARQANQTASQTFSS